MHHTAARVIGGLITKVDVEHGCNASSSLEVFLCRITDKHCPVKDVDVMMMLLLLLLRTSLGQETTDHRPQTHRTRPFLTAQFRVSRQAPHIREDPFFGVSRRSQAARPAPNSRPGAGACRSTTASHRLAIGSHLWMYIVRSTCCSRMNIHYVLTCQECSRRRLAWERLPQTEQKIRRRKIRK